MATPHTPSPAANNDLTQGLQQINKERQEVAIQDKYSYLRSLQQDVYASPTPAKAAPPAATQQQPAPTKQDSGNAPSSGYTLGDVAKDTVSIPLGAARDVAQSATDLLYDATNALTGTVFNYRFATPQLPEVQTKGTPAKVGRSIVQFVAPFTAALKGLQAAKAVSGTVKAATAGAATDFVAFDPHEQRLSNLILDTFENTQDNPVLNYLAASDNDTWYEGRMKNMLEGLGIGVALDGTIQGIKATKAYFGAKSNSKNALAEMRKAAAAQQEATDQAVRDNIKPASEVPLAQQIDELTGASRPKADVQARQGDLEEAFNGTDSDVADLFKFMVDEQEVPKETLQANLERNIKSSSGKTPQQIIEDVVGIKPTQSQAERKATLEEVFKDNPELADHYQDLAEGIFNRRERAALVKDLENLTAPAEARLSAPRVEQDKLYLNMDDGSFTVSREAPTTPGSVDLETQVKAAMEKPGFQRTAEEVASLRAYRQLQESLFDDIILPATKGEESVEAILRGIDSNTQALAEAQIILPTSIRRGQGGYIDPSVLLDAAQKAGRLTKHLVRTPGDAASSVAGGVAGFNAAEEDSSLGQRLGLAAIGAIGGRTLYRKGFPQGAAAKESVEDVAKTYHPVAQSLSRPEVAGISPIPKKAPIKISKAKTEELVQVAKEGRLDEVADTVQASDFNFAHLDSAEDIQSLMDSTSVVFAKEMKQATGGIQSLAETTRLAKALGTTPESLEATYKGLYGDTENLAARVTANRMLLNASAKRTVELAKLAERGDVENLLAFRKQVAVHASIQAQMKGVQTEIARALSAFRIQANSGDLAVAELDEMLEAWGGRRVNEQLAKKLATATDPDKLSAMVRRGAWARTESAVYEMWINGILSGPATHAVNVLGNSLVAAMSIAEKGTAAAVGRIFRGGAENRVEFREVQAHAFGMAEGLLDTLRVTSDGLLALRNASGEALTGNFAGASNILRDNADEFGSTWQALGSGTPVLDNAAYGTREMDNSVNAITGTNFGAQADSWAGNAIDALGTLVRLPGRALITTDELFKAMHYRGNLKANAYKTAKSEGLEGDALVQRMNELIEGRDIPITGDAISAEALEAARLGTFTNRSTGDLSTGMRAIRQTLPGRYLVPFMNTPGNIMAYVWERTPGLNLMNSNVRAEWNAGGARRDAMVAKMSVGGALYGAGAYLASQGLITGNVDRKMGAEDLAGIQKYSVKIGDKYYAYNRLDPVGMFLGLAADFADISGNLSDQEADKLAGAMIIALSQNLGSKSYMSGLTDLVVAIDDSVRSGNSDQFERWARNFGASFTPFSSAQRSVRKEVDPISREVWTYTDAVRNTIPGLSDTLFPRRNLFGDPVVYKGGLGPDIASPIYESPLSDNPAALEISRLNVDLTPPERTIGGNGGRAAIDLTPEQYDRYTALAGNEAKVFQGKGFKDYLREYVQTPEYQALSEAQGEYMGGKEDRIKFLHTQAKDAAKKILQQEYPELRKALLGDKMNAARALMGVPIVEVLEQQPGELQEEVF